MKTVIELSYKREVPENYDECSVCGIFHPPESFRNEDQQSKSRTNCKSCYEAPSDQWNQIEQEKERHKEARNKLIQEENHIETVMVNSVSVEALIHLLEQLPKDARIAITQSGYYSDGEFAQIHAPELKETLSTGKKVYVIGHSSQNP